MIFQYCFIYCCKNHVPLLFLLLKVYFVTPFIPMTNIIMLLWDKACYLLLIFQKKIINICISLNAHKEYLEGFFVDP